MHISRTCGRQTGNSVATALSHIAPGIGPSGYFFLIGDSENWIEIRLLCQKPYLTSYGCHSNEPYFVKLWPYMKDFLVEINQVTKGIYILTIILSG